MPDPAFPKVAADLDGRLPVEESVETVFRLPGATVRGATRRYDDELRRRIVRDATGGELDHGWWFFAVTRLGFESPLPPG